MNWHWSILFTFLHLGLVGTTVKDFVCVFFNMEYMKCNWGRSPKMPANSQQTLYFWYVIYPTKNISALPKKGQPIHHFVPEEITIKQQTTISSTAGWIPVKFYTDIYGSQWMNTSVFGEPLVKWWIVMQFRKDIHVPYWINCNQFEDLLTFHLESPAELNLTYYN